MIAHSVDDRLASGIDEFIRVDLAAVEAHRARRRQTYIRLYRGMYPGRQSKTLLSNMRATFCIHF